MFDADQTDETLLARLRAGDERAYEALHDRYRGRLLRYAERLLGPRRGGAEDVVQEAFLRAHRSLMAADRELLPGPWLYRIVRNACIDELRRDVPVPAGDPIDLLPAPDDAHAVTVRREALREVVRDVAALPPTQREALVAVALDGCSHTVAAARCGRTVGASKNLVNRARGRLADARRTRERLPVAA